MGDNKNFVKDITNIEEDFAQWYTDIVLKAELADYTNVKGFIAIRPYGYGIWENIQAYADKIASIAAFFSSISIISPRCLISLFFQFYILLTKSKISSVA